MTTAISEPTEAADSQSRTTHSKVKQIALALAFEYAMGRNEALEPDGTSVIRNKCANQERAKYLADRLWDSPDRLQAAANLLTDQDQSSPCDKRSGNNLRFLPLGQPNALGL